MALGGRVPAAGEDCPFRNGDLPVIATAFHVGDSLRAKLREPDAFERKAARKLAEELQCVNEVRFLDWKPLAETGADRGGVLDASLERKGEFPSVWIELRLFYSLTGDEDRFELTRLPANLAVVYASKEPQAPGPDGNLWLSRLEQRFLELAGDSGFRTTLAGRFLGVTLSRKDIREVGTSQKVVLPLASTALEAAEEKTVLHLSIQPKSGHQNDLRMHPACEQNERWLLGRLVDTPWSQALQAIQERSSTALWLESYQWEYPKTCLSRFEQPRPRP